MQASTPPSPRILADVRARGDAALLEYTARFDRVSARKRRGAGDSGEPSSKRAFDALPAPQREALTTAAARIRAFHERQRAQSWTLHRGRRHAPRAEGHPARSRRAVCAGRQGGVSVVGADERDAGARRRRRRTSSWSCRRRTATKNPLVLAAAHLAGVTRAFAIGGAQAIAALAYGTATIPAVDKIVGPGNAYVAAAKRRVFGVVGIDMVAGPSEILVIADASANPDWVAMDLFAQAEHDEAARRRSWSRPTRRSSTRSRRAWRGSCRRCRASEIIGASLARRGALMRVRSLDEACAIANRIAPEHLELAVADPEAAAGQGCTMRARSSSGITAPRRSATTAPAPIMCCPRRAARAFPRRSASTISRSAAA